MERAEQEGIWQYRARWRSTIGSVTIVLLLLASLLLFVAVGSGRFVGGAAFGAAAFAGLAWLLGKPLFLGRWVVRIGPRGISGHALNGRTVPWRDIRDLGVEVVQRNTFLVLTLAADATESLEKTRRWLSGRKPERRIPLTALRAGEIQEAVVAAQATFAERASPHAQAAVAARQEETRFEAAFGAELARLTPTTWALYLVVALNVGVWVASIVSGMSVMRPSSPDLFRWGANSAWAVTRDHEYWRLLTGTFLHGGLVHLAMNMLGLWSAGRLLERLYGNGQFLLVYLASALAGSAASLHFGAQAAVSVGASGAVFGVLGAVLVAAHRHRDRLPKALSRSMITSEGVFLAYALVNGFTREGIDNAAHVGGLLAGAALAWVLRARFETQVAGGAGRRAATAAAALVVVVAAVVFATSRPLVDHATAFATGDTFQRVVTKLQEAHRGLEKDARAAQAGRMTEPQLVAALEDIHLPALRSAHAELMGVPLADGDPRVAVREDMRRLTGATVEFFELQLAVQRGQAGADAAAELERLRRQMQASAQRLQDRAAAAKPTK